MRFGRQIAPNGTAGRSSRLARLPTFGVQNRRSGEAVCQSPPLRAGTSAANTFWGALLVLALFVASTCVGHAKGPQKPRTDRSAPTISVTAPLAGSTVSGTVTVNVSASDNTGVTQVNLTANGVLVASSKTAPYSFAWDSTKVANGGATLVATAYDAANNLASASTNVTVKNGGDTSAPSVSIASPLASTTVSGVVSVNVNATDNLGVARVTLTANNVLVASSTAAPFTFAWDSSKVADGAATLVATAYDTASNSKSASVSVTVQNAVATVGTTYYVSSSTGSDANPGTQAAPWRTVAKVYASRSLFKPGDSILLKRGDTWYEQFNITNQAGVSGTPITYGAYGSGNPPTVDAQKSRTFGVYMDNVSHIVVRDVTTMNAAADGFRIVAATGNVTDVVVQGVLSKQNARHGFSIEATVGVTHVDAIDYQSDEATLNGLAGFYAYHVSDGPTGIHYYDSKATYNGQLSANHGFSIFYGNNIHYHGVEAAFTNIDPATGLSNGYTSEGIGICFDDYTSNSSVEYSYSHNNARAGLTLAHQGNNNAASYNVIAFNGVYGLVVNGYSAGTSNIQILNNTIYGNNGYGIQAWQPINGLTIKNNIVANNAAYGIGFSAAGISNYTVATNLIFGNTKGGTAYVPVVSGTIVADPAFTAPASGNFSLQASSAAINKGLNLGSSLQYGLAPGSIWPSAVNVTNQNNYGSWEIGSTVYMQ